MGYDAVRGIATYGGGCMPGCARQFTWWRANYAAGSLGCYNPASKAGGGPSLHAEGRAMDIALNANDPAQRARGDAIFDRVMRNPEQFGAQEMLWRGFIWSWNRRGEGKRGSGVPGQGVQQAAHMNHVHLGIDVNAGRNWNEGWVSGGSSPPQQEDDDLPYSEAQLAKIVHDALLVSLRGDDETKDAIYDIVRAANRDGLTGVERTEEQNASIGNTVAALNSPEGQEAIRKAIAGK